MPSWYVYCGTMSDGRNVSKHVMLDILSRDFVLGFLAFTAFIIGYHALIPTLPIFLARSGSDEREIGMLIGIFGLSSVIFRFLVGRGLRAYSEKSIMMIGALLFALTFLACLFVRPFWPFLTVRFFQGVSFACFDTAVFTFIVNATPPARRGQAIGYFLLALPLSQAVAPVFGMFLLNQYNFSFFFLFCMGLSLCSFFLSSRLKKQEISMPDKSTPSQNTSFLERKIIIPTVTSFVQHFAWGALITFFPLYAIQCGITNPGFFFTANAVMLIMGRGLGGTIMGTWNKERIILLSIFVAVVALVVLSFARTLPMFIFVGLLWGAGSAFFIPTSMAYALEYAGSSEGTAVGTFRALMDLGLVLGPTIMGFVVPLTGYPTMFICLSLACVINMAYFQFYVRRKYHGISRV
jgi:MFS family permease